MKCRKGINSFIRLVLIALLMLTTETFVAGQVQPQKGNRKKSDMGGLPSKKQQKQQHRQVRVGRVGSAKRAIKKQQAKEQKLKDSYSDFVKDSKKRAYDIQSPEVKARMKENARQTKALSKARRKQLKNNSRNAGRKYN